MSQYNITITATDQGSPRLTSMTVISIQLSDVNDNPPMFERSFYNLHLRENNIPGLLIGSVHAVDVDTEQNAKLTYWLLPGKIRGVPASSYISISSETGNLYAIRSVDYEDIQDFQVMVRAVDKGSPPLSSETMVRVLIRDENDNAPFVLCPLQNSTSPSKELVPRGAETGYLVTKVVATDRDSGQNSWLSYQLLKATDPSLFAVGTQNGEVKTTRPVNIRDSFKHTLIVAVRDNGHPPQSASATLRILLVDGFSDPYMKIMDNPKSEVPQEEDHTLTMFLIICLVAISSIFLLSVIVFIATKFQKQRKFIGSSHSASNFPVGHNLQENCGDRTSDTYCQAYNYEVCLAEVSIISLTSILKEDSPLEKVVALFGVRDQDSGDNSKTVCSVEMNLPFVLKGTTNNFYQIVLQSPLDRETVTEYNITITAIDCGSPRLTSTRLINVQISDVNDNPPLFEKSSYDMQIRENHIPGLLIGSVHAVDLDTEQNAKVTYSVLPGKGDGLLPTLISINSETGNLYALRSLDYEQIRGFRVTVRASDGGSPSLSSEVIVRIHIIDENDNAPFFLYPLQNNTSPCNELVPKSAEAGYLVTKVVAVDADSGQNSWLSYELLKATDPALFSIGAQNGEVKTRRALNERDTNKQRLVILVRDNGLPPQTSTALLNVLLVDGFSDPFLRRVDVSVQEPEEDKTLTKYLVICLAAVSFVFLVCIVVFVVVKILKKDPQSHFTAAVPHFPPASADAPENCADSQNGSLPRTYRYDVCLTGGSLSSEFRFLRPLFPVFSVGDVNIPGYQKNSGCEDISEQVADNQLYEQNSTSPSKELVPRGAETGYLVTKVVAADRDSGQNSWLSYQLLKANGEVKTTRPILYSFHRVSERINNLFLLNERTGEITVRGQIDYEKERSHSINIKGMDGGGLSGHCKILIEIEDENDNPPEVSIISLISTLKEDSPPDTMVALFSVRDQDSGDNSKTVCSVEMNIPFVLKSTANNFYQLVLQSPLDRETVTEYNITITAIDCGSPKLTSTRLINVQISDVNDNPPLFEKPSYDMQIRENHIPGLLIGSVHAVDLDTKQNAKVTYSVLPGKGDGLLPTFISINSETGNLYALRSLDYEQIRGFRVTVRASDGGSPSLSSEVIVRIHIIDENDNAPFFLYPLQNNTSPCNELVPKSAEAGYLVTKVVAVDADSGQNSWLSYELLKATDPALFSIGVQNGEVKTRRALNERDTNKQRLVILVRDNGLPPQTSTALLNVLLVDGFSDPFLRRVDVSVQEPEEDKTLTKYLVICLAAVSFVFLVCIVVFVVVKILKKDPQSQFTAALPHFPPASADAPENCADSQNGSLPRTYRYDVCLTGGSLSSEFRFLRPLFPVFSVGDVNNPQGHRTSSGSQDTDQEVADSQLKEENSTSPSEELVPRGAETGYLVTKVVAADRDSGQNSWLSSQLLKATDPSLFAVGTQNGEVKTMRPVNIRDTFKHTLIVAVRDNGHPPQSASFAEVKELHRTL
ncbi:protocadherin beta-16-like [Crotalus adamanteus]|uniref:Protocadherin beta-16-like n=1 Tax=Crotalus adamanteus TaxID=8729 RepID=A0AAW1BQL2_CROAD